MCCGAVVAVSACAPAADRARQTVADYRADVALRHEEMTLCDNDPGTLGATPDCVNAREASRVEDTRRLRDLPPVQLPRKGKPYVQDKSGR